MKIIKQILSILIFIVALDFLILTAAMAQVAYGQNDPANWAPFWRIQAQTVVHLLSSYK